MPINIEAIKKAHEREKQQDIEEVEEYIKEYIKRKEEEEWKEWEKQQQEYADWASEHPEELEEMKIDDFYLNVAIDFERKLEVRKKHATRYSSDLSRSDLDSWYSLLKKKYDKKTIEEAFKRYGNVKKEEKKKSQVEQVLRSKYKKSYRILLKNLERAGIIEKSTTKQWKWNAKKIEFCFFVWKVNKEYKEYIDGDSPKYTPFVADFEVENGITNKYISQKISELGIKTYDRIEKCFPKD